MPGVGQARVPIECSLILPARVQAKESRVQRRPEDLNRDASRLRAHGGQHFHHRRSEVILHAFAGMKPRKDVQFGVNRAVQVCNPAKWRPPRSNSGVLFLPRASEGERGGGGPRARLRSCSEAVAHQCARSGGRGKLPRPALVAFPFHRISRRGCSGLAVPLPHAHGTGEEKRSAARVEEREELGVFSISTPWLRGRESHEMRRPVWIV
jgi:hypothetical protein